MKILESRTDLMPFFHILFAYLNGEILFQQNREIKYQKDIYWDTQQEPLKRLTDQENRE